MSGDRKSFPQKNHLSLVKTPQHPSEDPTHLSSLKIVTSNEVSSLVQKSEPSQQHYFTSEVRKCSPYDFIMTARDPFHRLHCELPLSFEENQEDWERNFSLVCDFPTICDEELAQFVEEDETLLDMALIQYHMQILKSLFLFGAAYNATNLIVNTTEDQFDTLGVYRELTQHVDKVPTRNGMGIAITLPIHVNSCSKLIDVLTEQFRKTLWQDYSENHSIRDYLAANVRFSVVN